jgi:hypothetical protein
MIEPLAVKMIRINCDYNGKEYEIENKFEDH